MPAAAPATTPGFATGQSHTVGVFSLKLNITAEAWEELGESLFLLMARPVYFVHEAQPGFDDYGFASESDFVDFQKAKRLDRTAPMKFPFVFKPHPSGGFVAQILSRWLCEDMQKTHRFGLAMDTGAEGGGFVLIQGLEFQKLQPFTFNLPKHPQDKRRIYWPGVWQPEFPWKEIPTLWRLPRTLPYIDSHLHIQSNHTAPLPLVWDKLPVKELFKTLTIGYESKNLSTGAALGGGAVLQFLAANPGAGFAMGAALIHAFKTGAVKPGLDGISGLLFGESGKIATYPTNRVGVRLGKELSKVGSWNNPFYPRMGNKKKGDSAWGLATPLMMDMHYGHFRGYFGEPIYSQQKDGSFQFSLDPFTGKKGVIEKEEAGIYEDWEKQFKATLTTSGKGSALWKLLPLFHLDPRRYRGDGKSSQSWKDPFKRINSPASSSSLKSPFVGVKMYTSLGYMPMDPLLPWQSDIYKYCESQSIPVMNHCTVEGMYTHDKPFYYDLWLREFPRLAPSVREKFPRSPVIDGLQAEMDSLQEQIGMSKAKWVFSSLEQRLWREKCRWYDAHYVYPGAWQNVLNVAPKLKLCLAHFCGFDFWGDKNRPSGFQDPKSGMVYGFPETDPGDLPDPTQTNPLIHQLLSLIQPENQVHADISFFYFTEYNREALHRFFRWAREYKSGFLFDRILWGTDWPLLVTNRDYGNHLKTDMMRKYAMQNFRELCAIDPELWIRFSLLNPARFYGLEKVAPHLESFLISAPPDALKKIPATLDELYQRAEKVF